MADENGILDFPPRNPHLKGLAALAEEKEKDTDEVSCPAYGFLRGLDQRALAVEFRFRNGNSDWFPYSLLASWRYDPSVGLLLKFTGDVVALALIRGSNLAAKAPGKDINLTDRGLQRHRILWIREMGEDEVRRSGEGEPTIDSIQAAEFESGEELREWVKKNAPAFIR
jgi:hypothetical protein